MSQKRDCHVYLYYEVRVTHKEKDYNKPNIMPN
jgi:hypothetical protein